jgi:uncharacterized protein
MQLKPSIAAAFAAFTALAAFAATAQDAPQKLPAVQLQAGMHLIRAEVARSDEQRAIGLMNRDEMPANDGMLFVFERAGTQCFWMKNTRIALTAAFIDDAGRIVNLADMKPQTLESHCSTKPVRYVLEMNQGWFSKRGIGPGAQIGGIVKPK